MKHVHTYVHTNTIVHRQHSVQGVAQAHPSLVSLYKCTFFIMQQFKAIAQYILQFVKHVLVISKPSDNNDQSVERIYLYTMSSFWICLAPLSQVKLVCSIQDLDIIQQLHSKHHSITMYFFSKQTLFTEGYQYIFLTESIPHQDVTV